MNIVLIKDIQLWPMRCFYSTKPVIWKEHDGVTIDHVTLGAVVSAVFLLSPFAVSRRYLMTSRPLITGKLVGIWLNGPCFGPRRLLISSSSTLTAVLKEATFSIAQNPSKTNQFYRTWFYIHAPTYTYIFHLFWIYGSIYNDTPQF